jgi:serine/threonine protein kinase
MLMFACSACQRKLSVKEEFAGAKVKCPGCGAVVLALTPANSNLQSLPTPQPGEPSNAATAQPSNLDGTPSRVLPTADHDASLTDFLRPKQADDELGRLGTYRILKILGHGGMGVVYKAEDPKLKRVVAIKAMLPVLAASASAGKRFLLEARAMAALEHDHIVRIYQVDEDRGVPFLAMEYLRGEPLEERLHRQGKLPTREILRIGREIAEALAFAHANGLVHRDIKPGNVWLESPRGRVKILDFGLARATSQESGLTQQGAIMGTPAYMAPEQVRGESVDARCDLFSLGVILYLMCTGKLPFVGKDTVSTLMEVAQHKPPAPVQVNVEVPPELSELVMKLLEKNASKRIGTAGEVIRALSSLEEELKPFVESEEKTAAADSISPTKTAVFRPQLPTLPDSGEAEETPRRHSLAPIAIGFGAVFGLLILAGGIFYFWPTHNAPSRVETDDKEKMQTAKVGPNDKGDSAKETSSAPGELGKAIDLLKLINVNKHARLGEWRFDNETLVIPPENDDSRPDRLQVPFTPPEAYELEVDVNRLRGNISQTLVIGLVVGDEESQPCSMSRDRRD